MLPGLFAGGVDDQGKQVMSWSVDSVKSPVDYLAVGRFTIVVPKILGTLVEEIKVKA